LPLLEFTKLSALVGEFPDTFSGKTLMVRAPLWDEDRPVKGDHGRNGSCCGREQMMLRGKYRPTGQGEFPRQNLEGGRVRAHLAGACVSAERVRQHANPIASMITFAINQYSPSRMVFWTITRGIHLTVGIVLFLVASVACSAAWAAEPKRVLMLHSFGRDFKPWDEYAKNIRTELEQRSPWPLDIYDFSLHTARFSDGPDAPFVDYLGALFTKQPLDLIVSVGAPAAGFVQQHRKDLFPSTPMLMTVVDERRVRRSGLTANDAAVPVSIDIPALVKNVLQLLPDTTEFALVIGNSPTERYWVEQFRNDIKPFADRFTFTSYNDLSLEDILKRAAAMPPQSAIFFVPISVDAAGVARGEDAILERLHAVAKAPIFSYADSFLGQGIVGGPMILVSAVGRKTAEVAVRILGGESGRHRNAAHRTWSAAIRLERITALGN
jgi:hypothetical protein